MLVRPVLPKEPPPGLPADQIGSIEVLVDEQGDVEQVKLLSPANRYHERMLMSAAKTWKFRPAFKDGLPVRYRTRIRVTVVTGAWTCWTRSTWQTCGTRPTRSTRGTR